MNNINLVNINKRYGDKVIFENYNLSINVGDFVCITGESGKGKSTLLNIIGLLDAPDSGEVEIMGIKNPIFHSVAGRKILKNEIAYVFQNYGLVEDNTVEYNLKIAAKYSRKKTQDFVEALSKVGLSADMLKKKVYQLSGGEQQRVALARLNIKPFSIILADEPTGSLDSENAAIVMSILRKFNDMGKTLIIVSHDREIAKCAKRVENL